MFVTLSMFFYGEDDAAKQNIIYTKAVENDKGKLLGRENLAKKIAKDVGKEKETNMKELLLAHCFDVRTFGIVYSAKPKFHLTGPVQFGWAHSLHPVESQYVEGTVVIPSKDATPEGEGKTQGTIWNAFTIPFAVFSMPGVINATLAKQTRMTNEDVELLLRALWQGTQHRQARGRGQQQPLMFVHVEYKDPFFRIGSLEDYVVIKPCREEWDELEVKPSSIKEIQLDGTELLTVLEKNNEKISRCRIWIHPSISVIGNMDPFAQALW